MINDLIILDRKEDLFLKDMNDHDNLLNDIVKNASFLVIGAAGSIGQAVTKEIIKRNPKKIHCVDLSENNLAELVRDIRSSNIKQPTIFKTFALDIGTSIYDDFISEDGQYDFVLNLSALKHVRSEKDVFTLMRMIQVNILNTEKTILNSITNKSKKYFCVSTDKATNPVNLMGASKKIMELYLSHYRGDINISSARFANVAFSNGSLLESFRYRLFKRQPISAPNDVKRYFITHEESGRLCLLSCLLGKDCEIFFPKLDSGLDLQKFNKLAVNYLESEGFSPYECKSEEEARNLDIEKLINQGTWPCLFSKSDTSGEKDYEEFYLDNEDIELDRFQDVGIIKSFPEVESSKLEDFKSQISIMQAKGKYTKEDIIDLFNNLIENFSHIEKGKSLDDKM
tara:strand:+ start:7571 stop:8764 length:1194 start_codon:yes stop_codon:yes gene_type:complete